MNDNVFHENIEYLVEARTKIAERNQMEQQLEEAKNKSKKMQKAVASEEKSITDEINATIKKRKNEIAASYDKELEAIKSKIKKTQTKREKDKSAQVGERIEQETAQMTEEIRQLNVELKTLFRKEQVPAFCKSSLYYALFMPKGIGEFLLLLCSILIGVGALPFGIYMLFLETVFKGKNINQTVLCVAVVSIVIIIVFALYVLLFNLTKVKHRDALREGRAIRDKIHSDKKNIKAIKNRIHKDKDESRYDLEHFDSKLDDYESESDEISDRKQEALTLFENQTKLIITQEIQERRTPKLEEMKAAYGELEQEIHTAESTLKECSLQITNQYEQYLGKEICKLESLNDIISIMEADDSLTVSGAIAEYKGSKTVK